MSETDPSLREDHSRPHDSVCKIHDFIRDMCENAGMIDWQDIHHLVMLGRLGTISAAAKALRVDHATVSRRVASLEKSVGLKLVIRLPKECRLTKDGEALVTIASEMSDIADAVSRYTRSAGAPMSGTVTVSALPVLANTVIAPSLPMMRERYPALNLVLNATSSIVSLSKGEADIAIGFVRPETPASIVRKIGTLELGLYATEGLVSRPPEEWTFVGFEETLSHIPQQIWLGRFAGARQFVLRSNDVTIQHSVARGGLGAAILPRLLGDHDPQLRRIDVENAVAPRELWLSVHADMRKSPIVRAVMDYLIDLFESQPLT